MNLNEYIVINWKMFEGIVCSFGKICLCCNFGELENKDCKELFWLVRENVLVFFRSVVNFC